MTLRRAVAAGLSTVALACALAGCGSGSAGSHPSGSSMSPGMRMGPSGSASRSTEMADDRARAAGRPSTSAREICNGEIRAAVGRNLDVSHPARGRGSWNRKQLLYTCVYPLERGRLTLTVKDLDRSGPGDAYYERLMRSLPGATPIRGVLNFGFSAFETPEGHVAFLKDDKTLLVDATGLTARDLPQQTSRQEIAYGVASSVIGCWTE
jgi:hypothetical protein